MSCGVISARENDPGRCGNTSDEGQQGEGETGTAAAETAANRKKIHVDHQGRIRSTTEREMKRVTSDPRRKDHESTSG